MRRHLARAAATIACLGLFLAVNHHGAQKVANYRCAHSIGTPCRGAR